MAPLLAARAMARFCAAPSTILGVFAGNTGLLCRPHASGENAVGAQGMDLAGGLLINAVAVVWRLQTELPIAAWRRVRRGLVSK